MFWAILLYSLLAAPIEGAERVEIAPHGVMRLEAYQAIVTKHRPTLEVTENHLEAIPGMVKPTSRLGRWFTFTTPKIDPSISKIVFMNTPSFFTKKYRVENLPKEKMVLFMWEPPIRHRKMYSRKTQNVFSRIYTFNDELVDGTTYFKFFYPVLQPMREDIPSFQEKEFCALVAAYLTGKSLEKFPGGLQQKREELVAFFEQQGEREFACYGKNWPVKYKCWRGPTPDKLATLKRYKFTICYENCCDAPGYITEKIFDCFAAGTVPIYWGAPNVTDYIPKGCFIDRRDFASNEELYAFMKGVTEEQYAGYRERIKAFLGSEEAQLFSWEHFEKTLMSALE